MPDPPAGGERTRLVVTADDMGLHADFDRAVIQAHDRGVVTSASIVTSGPTYRGARALLRDAGLDRGVHLNLLAGEPISPRADVSSLVDDRGRFRADVGMFLARYAAGRFRAAEIAIEWERQIRRAFDDGLEPTHLNGHYYLHVLPALSEITIDLASRFGIHWIRVPDEPPWHSARPGAWPKTAGVWLLARRTREAITDAHLGGLPCRGIAAAGSLGYAAWRALLRRLPEGTSEVVCHPGQGREETEALGSAELRRAIDARATRCSFRDLSRAALGRPAG